MLDVLDHHLLLADQLIHFQRQLLAVGFHHHHQRLAGSVVGRLEAVDGLQRQQRQVLATHAQHAAIAGDGIDVGILRLQCLDHIGQWQDQGLVGSGDGHPVQDGQGQRQPDQGAGTAAQMAFDLDLTAQRLDVPAHHIHADATAGQLGDRIGSGEARLEDQVPDLAVAGRIGHGQATFACLGQDLFAVQATAVVGHFDDDMPALVRGGQGQRAGRWLAGRLALLRQLQAVVDGVAHQVHQRIGDLLDQPLVQFGAFAQGAQGDLLAQTA